MFKQKITRDIVANCMHPDLMQYPVMEQYIDMLYTTLSNQADIYGLESKQKTELILVSRTDTAFQIIFWGAEIVFFRLGEIECMTEPFFKIRAVNAIEQHLLEEKRKGFYFNINVKPGEMGDRGTVRLRSGKTMLKFDRWNEWKLLAGAPKDVLESILDAIDNYTGRTTNPQLN